MDKHLSKNESRLHELVQSKNYSELNSADQKFVLTMITQVDYELERHVIVTASTLFEDEEKAIPAPLLIPQKSSGVLLRSMPIYQSLLAVAATVIFMLLVFPIHTENGSLVTKTEYIVKTDTVEIEKEIYKYDTIYQTVEKPIYIKQDVIVESNSNPCVSPIQEAPRLLQSSQTMRFTDLTEQLTDTKGTSLKDDNLSSLIVEF